MVAVGVAVGVAVRVAVGVVVAVKIAVGVRVAVAVIYFVREGATDKVFVGFTLQRRIPLENLTSTVALRVEHMVPRSRATYTALCKQLTEQGKLISGKWFRLLSEEVLAIRSVVEEPEQAPLTLLEEHAQLVDEARDLFGLLPSTANVRTGLLQRGVTALRTAYDLTLETTLMLIAAHRIRKGSVSPTKIEKLLGDVFAATYHPVALLYSSLGAADSEERSIVLARLCNDLEEKLGLNGELDYWQPWNAVVESEDKNKHKAKAMS